MANKVFVITDHVLLETGQPRRHLLTTGWSTFVTAKRLVAGDTFVFLRYNVTLLCFFCFSKCGVWIWHFPNYFIMSRGENGELRVGVRRANRQQTNMPSSVISSHSMHLGVLATACHATQTRSMFTVYYKPRYTVITHLEWFFLRNSLLNDLFLDWTEQANSSLAWTNIWKPWATSSL